MKKEYIFSTTVICPCDRLRVGDWVIYDCYETKPIAYLAQIIDIELNHDVPERTWLVLSAPSCPEAKIVRRTTYDVSKGYIRKIINPNI